MQNKLSAPMLGIAGKFFPAGSQCDIRNRLKNSLNAASLKSFYNFAAYPNIGFAQIC